MMPANCSCPHCHAKIPMEDVNVATDIALCRACGRTTSFSAISGSGEISLDCLNNPPRCIRVEDGFSGDKTIVYHRMSPALLFLIPFTALWSGGSMYGIYWSQIRDGKFDPGQLLFGLPFAFGTVVLLAIIAYLMFGKWVIRLDRGEGSVFVGLGPLGWTRRFSYNRDTIVSFRMTSVKINDVPQKGILVRTDDKDFMFGALLKDDAKHFIAASITKQAGRA
jgi:hypothetical protein